MVPTLSTGGVPSIRVAYATLAALPQASVAVTVIVALHAPLVDAVVVNGALHASVAVVAAIAAASAVATVG